MSAYTMKADADFNEFEAYYKAKAYKEAERRFYESGKTQVVYNDGDAVEKQQAIVAQWNTPKQPTDNQLNQQ
jgi:hypothetical protein